MALTEQETVELVLLLGKLEWPLDRCVFHALIGKIVSVPQELTVLDDQNRILTFYRKDEEYEGQHQPGTILRDNETVSEALDRLLRSELRGVEIESIENVGWLEIRKGNGPGENPTRHEISLLWLARVKNNNGIEGVFSPLDRLPENMLSHHRLIAEKVRGYLKTGRPILG